MVNQATEDNRSIGLVGATGIGVAAIVGGGILALAGVAFAASGPSAILAFGLNGIIAIITVLSFAELATRFPESGGTYTFARKVLSIETAFTVGWVVWFASIVAAALYAFGFAAFLVLAVETIWSTQEAVPLWLRHRVVLASLACLATAVFCGMILFRAPGGRPWMSIGKVAVFGVLIVIGLWKLVGQPATSIGEQLRPFFPGGGFGVLLAMGYTFIAFQGFDLIAAVGGEVRNARRTIPRAMLLSLLIALGVYLPLLLVVATVGVPEGKTVQEASIEQPEAIVAVAAQNYLGGFGYWLVIVAALLSMLSALQANLLAASHVAHAMARDRTLPSWLESTNPKWGTPRAAVVATGGVVCLVLICVKDVAMVGAASSLVFLVTFALVHRICIMARRRAGRAAHAFSVPGFPVVPAIGTATCLTLALFGGFSVPAAGLIVCLWLALGGILYATVFGRRAGPMDAFTQATDGELVRLRGRSPLVLAPVANPDRAEAMVDVANALAPPVVGRVMLLSIVAPPSPDMQREVPQHPHANVKAVLGKVLSASFERSLRPEVLATVATNPWKEIERVASEHQCESLLLGLSRVSEPDVIRNVERLIGSVASEVVVVRAPEGWLLRDTRRVVVPIAGRSRHDVLRARLLGSIHRLGAREITLLRIVPTSASDRVCEQARQDLQRLVGGRDAGSQPGGRHPKRPSTGCHRRHGRSERSDRGGPASNGPSEQGLWRHCPEPGGAYLMCHNHDQSARLVRRKNFSCGESWVCPVH